MDFIRRIWFGLMYLGKPPWDTGITPPEVMRFIDSHQPGRALDLGCGTGTNAITLAQHGWRVTGIDFAGKAIRAARRKAHQTGLEIKFQQGDVSRLEGLNGPFDLVLDIGCFHSLPARSRERYAANLPRLLLDRGIFLVYAWMDEGGKYGSGLGQYDLALLSAGYHGMENAQLKKHLRLVERQDGTERGARPSAWLTFQCVSDEPEKSAR
ncbi:MAG: hypothetical protein A2Z16_16150 [Chloroflexi bacterium RBG_16_54_18]|nr:MAG: hypothetical protein A2Z16_16150 [Chloroflexi bacterium RBG_16_54_18]